MKRTIATATLLFASLLAGCDDSATEPTPAEHEALTDLDLLSADELIDPDAPEPEDETDPGMDDHAGPDALVAENQADSPNPSNVPLMISSTSNCTNNSHCDSGERCDQVAGFVDDSGLTVSKCVGQCNANADCGQGETCGSDGYCDVLTKGHWRFCENGGCVRGHGDCDADADCEGNLSCVNDAGAAWGYYWKKDVCDYPAGHANYCSSAHPCGVGQGDCDSHSQCAFGTICKTDRGPQFGFASWVDVCLMPWQ